MSKPLTSYQVMTSVLKPKIKPSEEEIKRINQFFFCRFLSSDKRSVQIASFFNVYYKELPIVIQYNIAKQAISGRISWINFSGKEKAITDKVTLNLSRFYNLSINDAIEYEKLLTKDQKDHFRTLYPE